MSGKKELERIIKDARNQLRQIEEKELLAYNSLQVGRCFKVRSYYSCPQGPKDYWWQYRMVYATKDYRTAASKKH